MTSNKNCTVIADVIDLTLILKSIGFRLESLDIDKKAGNGVNICSTGNANAECFPTAKSLSPTKQDDGNVISVQITCGKSNIVSRMTYTMNDDHDCTCPHDAVMLKNTAFWEVQSTGLFVNGRTLGTSPKNNGKIVNDTSSNLLPVISEKSIVLTQNLFHALLKQYKQDVESGGRSLSQEGELQSCSPCKISNQMANGHSIANEAPETIVSGSNTPAESLTQSGTASPKSERSATSLTNGFTANLQNPITDRDANVIQNLTEIRHLVDVSLLQMKLNSSKLTGALINGYNLQTVTPCIADKSTGRFFDSLSASKLSRAIIARPALRRSTSSLEKKTTSSITPNKQPSAAISYLSRPKQDYSKVKSKVGASLSSLTSKETVSRSGINSAKTNGTSTIGSSTRLTAPKTRTSLGGNARQSTSTVSTATAPAAKSEITGTRTRAGRMSLPGNLSRAKE